MKIETAIIYYAVHLVFNAVSFKIICELVTKFMIAEGAAEEFVKRMCLWKFSCQDILKPGVLQLFLL
jgi:hypothetical protein